MNGSRRYIGELMAAAWSVLKKDVNITGNTSVMRTKEQGSNCQETSASPSSRQSSAKKEWFGERGVPVKLFFFFKKKKKDRLTRGRTQNEATRRREIRKVLDQFSGIRWILERNTGK